MINPDDVSRFWKDHRVRFIATIGSSIKIDNQYSYPYKFGKELDLFLKTNKTGSEDIQGLDLQGDVVYPDYFNQNTSFWWN